MDELLIEDKKYVSSKRAAKITGYAKDYIGQLCREGRVPARLVGRSWYVLESAIQDHRFGDTSVPPTEKEKGVTWAAPHYEASPVDVLPSVNRLENTEISTMPANEEKESEFSQHLQDSWRAWFDRVGDIESIPSVTAPEPEKDFSTPEIKEDEEVNIPIRTVYKAIYQAPPEELLPPRHLEENPPSERERPTLKEERRWKRAMVAPVQLAGALIAMILAITAVIGTGYFDTYILSNSQVRIIAGVILYNR